MWQFLLFILLFLYLSILLVNAYGFHKTLYFLTEVDFVPKPITIIICARNEEKHLEACLRGILIQNFSKERLQIILVNDASSDNSIFIAKTILESSDIDHIILTNNIQLGKKASITKAMVYAKHNIIISRDADTFTVSNVWLQNLSQFQAIGNYDLVIGPVNIANNSGLLWALQSVENRALAILSAGMAFFKKPFLCSGANLLFTKSVFLKVNGYESHSHIASGDDVLFLEEVKKVEGARIGFLKSQEAMVFTYPQLNLSHLILQKVRWAQKFKVNHNKFNFVLSLLIFTVNCAWIVALIGYFMQVPAKNFLLCFVLLKLLPELFLLFLSRQFMTNKHLIRYVLAVSIVYPFYTVLVAILSLFLQPRWK